MLDEMSGIWTEGFTHIRIFTGLCLSNFLNKNSAWVKKMDIVSVIH